MSNVPTNLIPTRTTELPEYAGVSQAGYFPYVIDGRTYKVQFSQIAATSEVPPTRSINTGVGLAGGGNLTQDRTIYIVNQGVGYDQLSKTGVVAGTYGTALNVPVISVDDTGRVTSVTTTAINLPQYVPTTRTITAGTGLTGGGDLSADRTISISFSSATPLSLGVATAGTATQAARGDHVHPAVDLSNTTETQGVLPLARGGTGNALSPVAGAIIYTSGTGLTQTAAGSAGQVLTSSGGGAPYWQTLTGTGTVTSVSGTGSVNGITLTGSVTTSGSLTLGGTLSNVSLTTQVAGTLPVASGGTGASTLTSGYLLVGNGTSPISSTDLYYNGATYFIGGSSSLTPMTKFSVRTGDISVEMNATSTAAWSFAGYKSRGTAGAGKTAVTNGDSLLAINAYGYEGTTYSNTARILFNVDGAVSAGVVPGRMVFSTSSSAGVLIERMRIDAAGNVGIGTGANASEKLQIGLGNIRLTDAYYLAWGGTTNYITGSNATNSVSIFTNSNSRLHIDSTGNVGIGTASPAYPLDVNGSARIGGALRGTSGSIASAATITPTSDTTNQYNVTALATGATLAAPSGTPVDGQKLTLRIKDNGTARALAWTTGSAGSYREVGAVLPTTTAANKTVYVGCIYNSADLRWDVVAVSQEA